ncbi:unnamed protein product [Heterobilharzia americana]|nr:unnamed protein product [Heterobilharzia americana]
MQLIKLTSDRIYAPETHHLKNTPIGMKAGYHAQKHLPISSPETTEPKTLETESETIDDTSDTEINSCTFKTEFPNSPDAVTPTPIDCPQIPLSSRSDTLSNDSDVNLFDLQPLSDNNRNKLDTPTSINLYDDEDPNIQGQKCPINSLTSSKHYGNIYQDNRTNAKHATSFTHDNACLQKHQRKPKNS